jgi:predicted XRE-type DNA-binding protein
MKVHTTKGSVFDDLGFTPIEAESLKIRVLLMNTIEKEMARQQLTQKKTAELLGVSQPRISDLKRGKISLFTIDSLIDMLAALHISVSITINHQLAA